MSSNQRSAANLRDKFFGCIAGVHIGSAMGAPVEGWSYEQIEDEYGLLDRLLPYHHYTESNAWIREPGTTEDGVERQKLLINAIIKKGGRVNAEDVRATWITDMNPEAPGNISEPFEGELLAIARTPVPANEIGKYCDYSGLVSFARSCHPIGLINAGDIEGAIADALEVGQLYQTANSRGLQWAAVTALAVAAATKPAATVDSVLGAIIDRAGRITSRPAGVAEEIGRALEATAHCTDIRQLRKAFDRIYSGQGMPYAFAYANEVVTKAICIFRLAAGDLREAIVAGVNMGRDTDCVTAVAAGITGALAGISTVPPDWVEQVDRAAAVNPYTCTKRTLREHVDGLYAAFRNRLQEMKKYAEVMEY